MDNPGIAPTESSSLGKRHGRNSFVAEDQEVTLFKRHFRRGPHTRGRGAVEWLYKDNAANKFRTFVHSTQRHVTVTLPALVYKFPRPQSQTWLL